MRAESNFRFRCYRIPMVFDVLREFFRGAGTEQPSVFYTLNPNDGRHLWRMTQMGHLYDDAGT
ncbi:MAG TPA: hypothetical protein VKI00_02930 [Mycobacterium sp.]|uniref:hypothetical protein n=1 Tax=Mycobacterium sp. TaxID=1785 RepID=UPI002B9C4428|nr:hypothetical protein [Mycobacterium sp.]HME74626.1 hypothetical protein [Mycobacterium sp.]